MSIRRLLSALLSLMLAAPPAHAEMAVTPAVLRVQVDGAVRRPGVYALHAGARVAEAIAAAGGPRPGARLHDLNLARAIADGERCHVPAPGEGAAAPPAAPAATAGKGRKRRGGRRKAARRAATPARPVDLNRASAAELDTLPGVGPAMAVRILAVRQRLGRFQAVDELREVPGIGAKRLAKLRPLVEAR